MADALKAFERYTSIEIVPSATDPEFRVKYVECVVESGLMRFVRREKRVARDRVESLVGELMGVVAADGR